MGPVPGQASGTQAEARLERQLSTGHAADCNPVVPALVELHAKQASMEHRERPRVRAIDDRLFQVGVYLHPVTSGRPPEGLQKPWVTSPHRLARSERDPHGRGRKPRTTNALRPKVTRISIRNVPLKAQAFRLLGRKRQTGS